jgi:hypothetical protein
MISFFILVDSDLKKISNYEYITTKVLQNYK